MAVGFFFSKGGIHLRGRRLPSRRPFDTDVPVADIYKQPLVASRLETTIRRAAGQIQEVLPTRLSNIIYMLMKL